MKPEMRWQRTVSTVLSLSTLLTSLPMLGLPPLPALAQAVPASVREAYTLLSQGLVNQAIEIFEQAVRQFPNSLEAQLGLAIAYRRAGRDADAFAAYQQVLDIEPNNRLALLSIGVLGGFRPEWQPIGIQALTVLLTNDPNDDEARAQRALLLGYQGRFAESLADYAIVLQRSPTPEALLGAAQIYTFSGDPAQGLALFEQYRSRGGRIEGDATIAYAQALRQTGNTAQAVQVLEVELRRSPEFDTANIRLRGALGSAYAANGQFAEAEAVLAPLRGRFDSRMTLARALNDLGEFSGDPRYTQEALALYQQVLTQTPNLSASLAREIADALSSYPQTQAIGLDVYRQLAQQQPNDRGLAVQIAVLERQLGLVSNADFLVRLQSLLQVFPTDPVEQNAIAQALVRLESPDPALLPLYEGLLNAGVDQPFLLFRIAQIQIQLNNFPAARSALAAYAATPAGSRDVYASLLLLAEIDRREGNLEASAQRYESILVARPNDVGVVTAALQGLAGIRQAQGRLPEAVALYDQIIALNPQDFTKVLGRTSLAYQAGLISQAEAEAVLNTWFATQPPNNIPPELIALVGALPATPQREGVYVALLQIDPDNTALQLRLAQAIALRDPAQAQALLEQLIARNPNNVGAYFVKGQVAQELGDLSAASDAYETILSLEPRNTGALVALGGVRFQQQRYTSAARLYNEALALDPQNIDAQSGLIGLNAAQGRRLEAIEQLEQLQLQRQAAGVFDPNLARQQQQLEEGFLQQRGFQPGWERY